MSGQSLLPFLFELPGRDPSLSERTYYLCAVTHRAMQISLSESQSYAASLDTRLMQSEGWEPSPVPQRGPRPQLQGGTWYPSDEQVPNDHSAGW